MDPNRKVLTQENAKNEEQGQNIDLELTNTTPTTIPDAATQENASMLIRIVKPYCRNADFYSITAAIQIESYCVGTVISNGTRPFVITAAHCFATECPLGSKVPGTSTGISGASDSIPMANIQIPNSAAIAKDMTGFDWSNSRQVLTATNVKILPGFTGQLQRGALSSLISSYWYGANSKNHFRIHPLYISRDIAVIDFGPQLALNTSAGTGYPSLQYNTTANTIASSTMVSRCDGCSEIPPFQSTHFSCWYKSANPNVCSTTDFHEQTNPYYEPRKLERIYEPHANDTTIDDIDGLKDSTVIPNSFTTNGSVYLGNSNSFAAYTIGRITFGDSGASMLYKGTVIGIASALQIEDDSYYGTGLPTGYSNPPGIHPFVLYSSIDKTLVDQGISSLINATSSSSVTLGVDLWAVKNPPNWTSGDNTPIPTGAAHAKRFISTYSNPHVTTSNTTAVKWAKVPVTTGATTYVKSYTANGVLDAIPAIGSGKRTATWVVNGLKQGYYDVAMRYPMNSGNAKCIQVLRRTNADTSYIKGDSTRLPIFGIFNQQIGDAAKTVSNTFNPTLTSFSPIVSSPVVNSKTYVWVSNNAQNAANSGVLGIKITDAGCGTATVPAGRMIGDTIELTLKGTTK